MNTKLVWFAASCCMGCVGTTSDDVSLAAAAGSGSLAAPAAASERPLNVAASANALLEPCEPGEWLCEGNVHWACYQGHWESRGIERGYCGAECTPNEGGCEFHGRTCWGEDCRMRAANHDAVSALICNSLGQRTVVNYCVAFDCSNGTSINSVCAGMADRGAECWGSCP